MSVRSLKAGIPALVLAACSLSLGCALLDGETGRRQVYDPPGTGDRAPEFWMKNQDQARVSLADFAGNKNVILVFFPLAFTPV
jgi:hypothetical protein